nr:epidermal growth factor receptor substrate 15-like 1 [Ipomoea batatas]
MALQKKERKLELQQSIIRMEQGGSADGILQVRADRIQSDLEELLKALTERCKKHSVTKSTALIELPHVRSAKFIAMAFDFVECMVSKVDTVNI